MGSSFAQLRADAGRDVVLCYGDTGIIGGSPTASGGSGAYNYSWSPSTGLSSTTVSNPRAFPTVQTTYTVTVTDLLSASTATDNVIVYITSQSGQIYNLGNSYCKNASSFTLLADPPGGVFSGIGVTGSTFDPSIVPIGGSGRTVCVVSYSYTEETYTVYNVFDDDFSKDKGWTGYDASPLDSGGWQRRAADPVNSCGFGAVEPKNDNTSTSDEMLLGTFIGQCFPVLSRTWYITSPVINCSNVYNITLNFYYVKRVSF